MDGGVGGGVRGGELVIRKGMVRGLGTRLTRRGGIGDGGG